MVHVDHHHFGRPPRGSAGFDGTCSPVPDFQEGHEPGRFAAARQWFTLAAQMREVGASPRPEFEESRFTDPQVHDSVFVYEIIIDALNEAGVRLWMLISAVAFRQFAALKVHIMMALRRTVDAICPVEARIEPLWGVGRGNLCGQHEAQFVVKRAGIRLGVEIAAFPAPIGPGASQPVKDLPGVFLRAKALVFRQIVQAGLVCFMSPKPGRNVLIFDRAKGCGHACFAEVFLRQNISRNLAPVCRNCDVIKPKHNRAVGVSDFACRRAEFDSLIRRFGFVCETSLYAHLAPIFLLQRVLIAADETQSLALRSDLCRLVQVAHKRQLSCGPVSLSP